MNKPTLTAALLALLAIPIACNSASPPATQAPPPTYTVAAPPKSATAQSSNTIAPAHWVSINHGGTGCASSIEMDAASMSRHSDIIRVWTRVIYSPACNKNVQTYLDLSDYDCKDNTWRQVEFNSYDWSGSTTIGKGDENWYHAAPGTVAEGVLMYGCVMSDNK